MQEQAQLISGLVVCSVLGGRGDWQTGHAEIAQPPVYFEEN